MYSKTNTYYCTIFPCHVVWNGRRLPIKRARRHLSAHKREVYNRYQNRYGSIPVGDATKPHTGTDNWRWRTISITKTAKPPRCERDEGLILDIVDKSWRYRIDWWTLCGHGWFSEDDASLPTTTTAGSWLCCSHHHHSSTLFVVGNKWFPPG